MHTIVYGIFFINILFIQTKEEKKTFPDSYQITELQTGNELERRIANYPIILRQ